jgi:hypothetical protein
MGQATFLGEVNGARNQFVARGGNLVHLVRLVYLVSLVCLVQRTKQTR